jgi:hypothetical protein
LAGLFAFVKRVNGSQHPVTIGPAALAGSQAIRTDLVLEKEINQKVFKADSDSPGIFAGQVERRPASGANLVFFANM